MIREDERLDDLLRVALAEHVAEAVPGPDPSALRRVRERIAGAARRRRQRRRVALAIAAAAAALTVVTSAAFATGVIRLNQPLVLVPQPVWMQHFQEEHHGTTGKGSAQDTQPATLAAARRSVHFHLRTLQGVAGAELVGVTTSMVTYRDGGEYPEVEIDYAVGAVRVDAIELQDANPKAPFEVPDQLLPTEQVVTIDGSRYLFIGDVAGQVRAVQYKTSDGGSMSINFFGPPDAAGAGPGGADPAFAENVIRHLT